MILEIISPERIFFKGEIEMLIVPGTKGRFTILPKHAPIISTLTKGDIIYVVGEKDHHLTIDSGFVEVHNDEITVCVESIAKNEDTDNKSK